MCSIFKDFARVYDQLNAEAYPSKAWADYFEKLLQQYSITQPNLSIVDVACGTGDTTIELQKRGYRILGIDNSIDMLNTAKEKTRRAGEHIDFLCQDMRMLELHRPVDVITCFCDGLNYMLNENDLMSTLSCFKRQLKVGGLAVFDVSTVYKLRYRLADNTFIDDDESITFLWLNHFNAEKKICQMDLTWFVKDERGFYSRYDETHEQRGYDKSTIIRLMRSAGFKRIQCFDEFSLNKPHKKSERIFFVGQA